MAQEEAQQRMFGPVAVVATRGVSCSEERAVTAMKCLDVRDIRVRDDDLAALRHDAQKGIVKRVQDQCRNGDPVEHARSGRTVIVVVRASEAGIKRSDAVVKLSNRTDADGSIRIVSAGKQRCLAPEPAKQGTQKLARRSRFCGA